MKTFEEVFGNQRTVTLAAEEPVAAPATVKATPEVERVEVQELENCYIFDPITFNSINKACQTIMSAGHELVCEDKSVLDYFNNFLDKIGKVGEDITWDEMLQTIFQNQMIYGNAYIETVLNVRKNMIVDLVSLDPKRIGIARDGSQKIVLDKYGKPLGYTQELPYGVSTEGKGDPKPDEVSLGSQQIFLSPQRMSHFKLYTFGDRFFGLGLIEPGYKSILRKQNIEEAQANSIYARGTYPLIDYVGDENHYPTPQMIKTAAQKLKLFQHNRYFAFPHWHKITPLEVKQSEIVDQTMNYLRENQAASLGMPMAFAVGSGEKTNRATLASQQKFLEFTLNDVVKRTISSIRKFIFRRICLYEGFKEVPNIKWENISAEEINEKTERLVKYVQVGTLKPEEVSEFAKKSEGI